MPGGLASSLGPGGDSTNPAWVVWAGRIAAPLLAIVALWLLPVADPKPTTGEAVSLASTPAEERTFAMAPAARATAAIGVLMVVLWITEGLPLAATSLLPLLLFPLTGVLSFEKAAAPYADRFIFLFLGGFMLALAISRWGLDRRLALLTVLAVGVQPRRLVAGFMVACGFISLWISNTATAAMMLPLGTSVVRLLGERLGIAADQHAHQREHPAQADFRRFSACLMLGIAYAASIGGVGTLIGTPPNAFLAAFMHRRGHPIGFADWMILGIPLATVYLLAAWLILTRVVFPVRMRELPGGRELIRREFAKLGPMSRGETAVLVVFLLAAAAWIAREPLANWQWLAKKAPVITGIDDAWIAMAAAICLFVWPVDARRGRFALDWNTARQLPWDVLLLFGGGLSLSAAITESGLAQWIGNGVAMLSGWPVWLVVVSAAALVLLVTEFASNTATASAFLPILAGVAGGLSVDELWILAPATIAATCGFVMPVGTPPNALVFGSGQVTIAQMARAGILLDLLGLVLIPVMVYLLGPWALGLNR